MSREFDIIVFGASGFTGKHVVEQMAISTSTAGLKWAVAGRYESKLRAVLDEVTQVTGKDVKGVTVVEADTGSEESLDAMCKRTRIVLNCVGPYRFYGEPVVKACIANGTDQIDISGEPSFLESMQLKYNEDAEKAKVYVLGAAGFDSIPCEMGLQVLKDKFGGDVNAVETVLKVRTGSEGASFNVGTWESAIYGIANRNELKSLRKELFKNPIPKSIHPLKPRSVISYHSDVKTWCIPFPVTDPTVVRRTQYYNYHHRKLRPSPAMCYLAQPSVLRSISVIFFAVIFGIMANFALTRTLLLKYPSVFSFGMFSKNGPTRKQMEETNFSLAIVGIGYDETLPDPDQQHSHQPNKRLTVTVSGPEPAYVATPICMIQVAMCVLREREKMPGQGGVMTPGAALLNTSLVSRLSENGLKFVVGAE